MVLMLWHSHPADAAYDDAVAARDAGRYGEGDTDEEEQRGAMHADVRPASPCMRLWRASGQRFDMVCCSAKSCREISRVPAFFLMCSLRPASHVQDSEQSLSKRLQTKQDLPPAGDPDGQVCRLGGTAGVLQHACASGCFSASVLVLLL